MAFREQHARFPLRGREAKLEGEDSLAQRIARAVLVAQQHEELRQQFGDFLESWTDADAALEAAVQASRSALEEGVAFREQHGRHPRRGRQPELEAEDALAQRIQRGVCLWHSRRNPLRWNSLISYHPGRVRLSHQRAPWRTCSEAEPCWKSWNLFPVACFAHIDIMLGM